jgi:hypothetical protein
MKLRQIRCELASFLVFGAIDEQELFCDEFDAAEVDATGMSGSVCVEYEEV